MMTRGAFLVSAGATLSVATLGPARAASSIEVLYAGSLVTMMERSIVPAAAQRGLDVHGEGKGSVALANLIRGGFRSPDVFISADPAPIGTLMGPPNGNLVTWYVTFATTRLVIGYAPSSPFAHSFVDVERGRARLVDVLLEPGLRLGRTDPVLDPKGYRTLFAAQLLERAAGRPGFAAKLLGENRNPAQILPEEALLARLEGGDLDAAFLYATESVTRRLPAVELPKAANLGDPAQAATYASARVTIDGVTRTGAPAAYALTIPSAAPNPAGAASFVEFLLSRDGHQLLVASGVTVVPPMLAGNHESVPISLRPLLA
jgi:molybdate/tungstate transport system substrate-binding protein